MRRKSRRPTLEAPGALPLPCMLASSSCSRPLPRSPLSRQLERLCFYFQECLPERTDPGVELRFLADRQVGEETTHPRRDVLLEDLALGAGWRIDGATREGGHDL